MPCDSSQREALRSAARGESFVLYGPPGTGKSSTIAAMIADALYKGKRVLFVAEKRAAIDVVKARLDRIGIGDFCLDLPAKCKLSDISRSLLKTLALPRDPLSEEEDFRRAQKRAKECEDALQTARTALYAEKDGFSAFRAAEKILLHRNIPPAVEVAFYGEDVSPLVRSAVAAARECGEIKVGRTEFSESFREGVLHGARGVLLEVRHFKAAFALFSAAFGQRARPFPLSALDELVELVNRLSDWRFCRRVLKGKGELRLLHTVFSPLDLPAFSAALARMQEGEGLAVLEGTKRAAEGLYAAMRTWEQTVQTEQYGTADELSDRAGKFLERLDLLPRACDLCRMELALRRSGVRFLVPPEGLDEEDALASYEKERARAYLEKRLRSDLPLLTGKNERELENAYLQAEEKLHEAARKALQTKLLSRLPKAEECGAIEAHFVRMGAEKHDLSALFSGEIPIGVLAPCLLMSPASVSRFLPAEERFDLVVFDEASQLTTEDALPSVARGRAVVAAGDPKQLPPTSFFRAGEGRTSVLDDLLLLGFPEKRLIWHYRSKHESLISFSNAMYYENRLRTVPPCDGKSRVRLIAAEGVYDRGGTKTNLIEAEKLTDEIVRRLQDEELKHKSMGVVTFSEAQQKLIEKLLLEKLSSEELRARAYERKEPLFCKNLENVQGDERDVVLISVCYGPSADGKLSRNFGPLNRAGGSRRLNVALSRAREEMLVFSSFPVHAFQGKASGGAADLCSFLKYAARGTHVLPREGNLTALSEAIGEELEKFGYRCRHAVGTSDFTVDLAVLDPKNEGYLLGILLDGGRKFSFEDEANVERLLTRAGWNIERVGAVEWIRDKAGVISRLKEKSDELSGRSRAEEWLKAYCRPYRKARFRRADGLLPSDVRDGEIEERLRRIVAVEGPISRSFLKTRCIELLQTGGGEEIEKRIDRLIDGCRFPFDRAAGVGYFYSGQKPLLPAKLRIDSGGIGRAAEDFSAYEIVSAVKGALHENVSLSEDEAVELLKRVLHVEGEDFTLFVKGCISYGEERGVFSRSAAGRLLVRENP